MYAQFLLKIHKVHKVSPDCLFFTIVFLLSTSSLLCPLTARASSECRLTPPLFAILFHGPTADAFQPLNAQKCWDCPFAPWIKFLSGWILGNITKCGDVPPVRLSVDGPYFTITIVLWGKSYCTLHRKQSNTLMCITTIHNALLALKWPVHGLHTGAPSDKLQLGCCFHYPRNRLEGDKKALCGPPWLPWQHPTCHPFDRALVGCLWMLCFCLPAIWVFTTSKETNFVFKAFY